uniref:Uncharacterized protein n=1 Tax=Anguilla anguilla TaxID=7936 RepID=A0A0E9WIQ6_ANGAN
MQTHILKGYLKCQKNKVPVATNYRGKNGIILNRLYLTMYGQDAILGNVLVFGGQMQIGNTRFNNMQMACH